MIKTPGYLRHIALLVFLTAGCSLKAQQAEGKLVIFQDSHIPVLLQKHIQYSSKQKGIIDGYRIQIFFDSGAESKKRAVDARFDFQAKYPECASYLSFQEPFYKVRVGDFRYRVEADGFLEKIKNDYPNGFTVKDKIYFPVIE